MLYLFANYLTVLHFVITPDFICDVIPGSVMTYNGIAVPDDKQSAVFFNKLTVADYIQWATAVCGDTQVVQYHDLVVYRRISKEC